jgi:hypothetical protein
MLPTICGMCTPSIAMHVDTCLPLLNSNSTLTRVPYPKGYDMAWVRGVGYTLIDFNG